MEYQIYESFEDRVLQVLIQFIKVSIDTFTAYNTNWEDMSKSQIAVLDADDAVASIRELPEVVITISAEGFSLTPGGMSDKTEEYTLFMNEGLIGPYLLSEDYVVAVKAPKAKEASRLVAWLTTLFLVKKEAFTKEQGIADVTPMGSSKIEIVGGAETKYAGRQLVLRVTDHIAAERIALNKMLINKTRVLFRAPTTIPINISSSQ